MANFIPDIEAAKAVQANSSMPEINAFFSPIFQNRQLGQIGGAVGASAAQDAENERAAAAAARAKKEADIRSKMKAIELANDPKYFQRVRKEDGGFDFLKGDGTPITAWQFADARGQDLDEVLKGSKNEVDMQFLNDYKNMQTFLQASSEGNKEALDKIFSEQPELKNMKYQDLMGKFRSSYANIFGHYEGEQGDQLNKRVVNSPSISGYNQQVDSQLSGGNNDEMGQFNLGGARQSIDGGFDQEIGGGQSSNQNGMAAYLKQQEDKKKNRPWWEQIGGSISSLLSGGG